MKTCTENRKPKKILKTNKLQEKALVSQKFFYFLFQLKVHIFCGHPPHPAWCLLRLQTCPAWDGEGDAETKPRGSG